jgi:leucyl aminopeptidase
MTDLPSLEIAAPDPALLASREGRIVIACPGDGPLPALAKRLDRLTGGAVKRLVASAEFLALKPGDGMELAFPAGLKADAVQVLRLGRKADQAALRRAGVAIGRTLGPRATLIAPEGLATPALQQLLLGFYARAYEFRARKSDAGKSRGPVTLWSAAEGVAEADAMARARAEALYFTRDLVNEPANILTTTEFATRLEGLRDLGVTVEVLDEPALRELGMGALLGVGQGSDSPSKVVVMTWKGAEGAPLALVGKGVCFDTGGISIKPAASMEEMTMDMGGAAVVAGVMRLLALRKAPAHVVGLVGLVENMPSGRAQRPGDVVTTMKGDTVEVINTDAEGRLVLADVLWYAQDRFQPAGIVDLATLTGAIIVALGSEHAGMFSNDDALAGAVARAARAEGEGLWRMPMAQAHDDRLKSRVADMMNVGGREASATIAAHFLQRFIKAGQPWVHLDIAGVTLGKAETTLAPAGATGWGVLTLDRLVADRFERRG